MNHGTSTADSNLLYGVWVGGQPQDNKRASTPYRRAQPPYPTARNKRAAWLNDGPRLACVG